MKKQKRYDEVASCDLIMSLSSASMHSWSVITSVLLVCQGIAKASFQREPKALESSSGDDRNTSHNNARLSPARDFCRRVPEFQEKNLPVASFLSPVIYMSWPPIRTPGNEEFTRPIRQTIVYLYICAQVLHECRLTRSKFC